MIRGMFDESRQQHCLHSARSGEQYNDYNCRLLSGMNIYKSAKTIIYITFNGQHIVFIHGVHAHLKCDNLLCPTNTAGCHHGQSAVTENASLQLTKIEHSKT